MLKKEKRKRKQLNIKKLQSTTKYVFILKPEHSFHVLIPFYCFVLLPGTQQNKWPVGETLSG